MKKALLFTASVFSILCANAQTFWLENWTTGTPCSQSCTTYTSTNGIWKDTVTGANGAAANIWYYSKTEDGNGRGKCESSSSSMSLHVGNVSSSPAASVFCPTGDCGASYDASSGSPSVLSHQMAKSPVINCTGKSGITLSFNYVMKGEAAHDYGMVFYFDGTKWDTLTTPPVTVACTKKSTWTYFSVALPASANNNPKVRIGFNWQNDTDGIGSDPSFAIDSIRLSTNPSGINELTNNEEINVYPNPSNGRFTVVQSAEKQSEKIEVYNVLGEKALTLALSQSGEGTQIDLTDRPSGIYFYRILGDSGVLIGEGKLIKL